MPTCVECGAAVSTLYTEYSRGNIRLTPCVSSNQRSRNQKQSQSQTDNIPLSRIIVGTLLINTLNMIWWPFLLICCCINHKSIGIYSLIGWSIGILGSMYVRVAVVWDPVSDQWCTRVDERGQIGNSFDFIWCLYVDYVFVWENADWAWCLDVKWYRMEQKEMLAMMTDTPGHLLSYYVYILSLCCLGRGLGCQ